ncbi:MAG: hypothetical protein JWP34_2411 [Massilia sp.]|nr:hypothetical protein [Massilia sp.]
MQTQPLPIQVSSASSAPTRATGVANTDSAQFSQALSREVDQRQQAAAPAPEAREQASAKPPAPASPAAAPSQAKAADGKTEASDTAPDKAKDDAADAAAAGQVTDMLALMASFNQPVAAATAAAAQAGGVGKQARDDALIATAAKPVLDDKGLPIKDGALDAAAAFALKMLPAQAAPKPAAPGTGQAAGSARGAVAADALAGAAAQKPDADGASATTFKAALQGAPVQPDQLSTGERGADAAALKELPAAALKELPAAALKELPAAAALTAPMQQASAAIAQAVTGAPTDRIAARVGTPGWDNQVSQKIVWMVAGKEQSATLTLNPPDMGPMHVVLNVTNDKATVTFTAAQPEVRHALENAMPKLREMMSESGIALGNATVSSGSDQRQAQQGEQSRGGGSGGRFGSGGTETAIPAAAARPARQSGGEGLVDTFA